MLSMALIEDVDAMAVQVINDPLYVAPPACWFTKVLYVEMSVEVAVVVPSVTKTKRVAGAEPRGGTECDPAGHSSATRSEHEPKHRRRQRKPSCLGQHHGSPGRGVFWSAAATPNIGLLLPAPAQRWAAGRGATEGKNA